MSQPPASNATGTFSGQAVSSAVSLNHPIRSGQNLQLQLNNSGTLMRTNLQAAPGGIVRIAPRLVNSGMIVPPTGMTQQMILTRPMMTTNANLVQPINIAGSQIQMSSTDSVAANGSQNQYLSQAQSSIMENVKKCRNFLQTLIKLASSQPPEIVQNVTSLIQSLINGSIEAEAFTTRLQVELNSSPQPYLVPFLKKNLPYLRQLMAQNQLQIEGVKPPSIPQLQPVVLMSMSAAAAPTVGTSNQSVMTGVASSQATTAGISQPQGFAHIAAQLQASGMRPAATARLIVPQGAIYPQPALSGAVTTTASKPAPNKPSPAPSIATASRPQSNESSVSNRDQEDSKDMIARLSVADTKKDVSESPGRSSTPNKSDGQLLSMMLGDRVRQIAERNGVYELGYNTVSAVRAAVEEKLSELAGRLAVATSHRVENMKMDPQHEVVAEPRLQLKFLDEVDKCEKKRHEDAERVVLLQAVKSRSKNEDPEQLKLREKAKALQQAEMEELRQREANLTALAAIGPRKKRKLGEVEEGPVSVGGTAASSNNTAGATLTSVRQRTKRVCMKDIMCVLEMDQRLAKSKLLYRQHAK